MRIAARLATAHLAAAAFIIVAPTANDAAHQALGNDPAFAAVVRINRVDSLAGTGTLIAPTWVLTAAHVVAGQSPDSMRVVLDTRTIAVRQLVMHPAWKWRIDDPDLALIELATPVADIAPLALSDSLPSASTEITIVGYGAGGPMATDRGAKRGATNSIDQVGGRSHGTQLSAWHLSIDFDDGQSPAVNALGDASPTRLEGINSGGDSGGPWLVQQRGAAGITWRIAAVYHVTSYNIGNMASTPPRFGGAVAMGIGIAPFRPWIDSTLHASVHSTSPSTAP